MEAMPRNRELSRRENCTGHGEPFAVESGFTSEKAELRRPVKTAYAAGTPRILKRFTTPFGAVTVNIELRALRRCKSM